jgi:acyl carrier protein
MSTNAQAESIPAEAARAGGVPSAATIEAWLIEKVAELLAFQPGDIDAEKELSVYGLSSMTGVMLIGDIEDWLGIKLEPTVAWEHPTVRSLAGYLVGELNGASAGGAAEAGT